MKPFVLEMLPVDGRRVRVTDIQIKEALKFLISLEKERVGWTRKKIFLTCHRQTRQNAFVFR